MGRSAIRIAAAIAVLVGLTGCGSDAKPTAASTTTTTTTTEPPPTTTTSPPITLPATTTTSSVFSPQMQAALKVGILRDVCPNLHTAEINFASLGSQGTQIALTLEDSMQVANVWTADKYATLQSLTREPNGGVAGALVVMNSVCVAYGF